MDEAIRRLERLVRTGDPDAIARFEAALNRTLSEQERRARELAKLRAAQREHDPDEHPALFRRNAVEGRAWKRGWRMICHGRKWKRYLKRKAHKDDRRGAKAALRGDSPRAKKRTGDSYEVW